MGDTLTPPPFGLWGRKETHRIIVLPPDLRAARCAYCGLRAKPDAAGACPACAGRQWVKE